LKDGELLGHLSWFSNLNNDFAKIKYYLIR
jgi:hypothetical protein